MAKKRPSKTPLQAQLNKERGSLAQLTKSLAKSAREGRKESAFRKSVAVQKKISILKLTRKVEKERQKKRR